MSPPSTPAAETPNPSWNWRREPVVHFALVAILLFLMDAGLRNLRGPGELRIDLRPGELQAGGPGAEPGGSGSAAASSVLDDQLMLREAIRLGLGEGDPIVARRLRQKLLFLWEAGALQEPDDQDLQCWLDAHPSDFVHPPRSTLRHHSFLGPDGGPRAERGLARLLEEGREPHDPDPFLHGSSFESRTPQELDELFGPGFAASLESCSVGAWCGPVDSRYGAHVVWVERRTPGLPGTVITDRAGLRMAWQQAQRERAREEGLRSLRRRAAVFVDGQPVELETD